MPNPASDADVAAVKSFLKTARLTHLRCRRRADTVVIESGPTGDSVPHIRLRKLGARIWATEAATHTGRWERMPLRGPIVENLQAIADTFPWLLGDRA
jgi:hypothetical protein